MSLHGGMCVAGSIYGRGMEWLVDTGCDVALLSSKVYYEIPSHLKPKLSQSDIELVQADGTPLETLGRAPMTFCVGTLRYHFEVVVGNCG